MHEIDHAECWTPYFKVSPICLRTRRDSSKRDIPKYMKVMGYLSYYLAIAKTIVE